MASSSPIFTANSDCNSTTMIDYKRVLLTIADSVENQNVDPFVESAALREAADYINTLEKGYEASRKILAQVKPEMFGSYFITGEMGSTPLNMPEYLLVCPEYGCDFSVRYKIDEQ